MPDWTRRAAVAERAARAGGAVARQQFREEVAVETKAHQNDLVTAADREAQRQVLATVHEAFPGEAFVCEEAATPPGPFDCRESVPDEGAAWVVDPIDGTANYVREARFWATSVASVVDGRPVGAATYLPALGDCYAAGPESVTRNGEAISVSDRTDPLTFAVGLLGSNRGDGHAAVARAASDRLGDLRRLGSVQGTLALVAAGTLDAAFMLTRPNPWDAIAGVLLIREAGGTVTDATGDPWRADSRGLVVSNGRVHDAVCDVVREAVGTDGEGPP